MDDDGTRDCPGCLAEGIVHPNRIEATVILCVRCDRVAHNDAMAGIAQMAMFMRRHGEFADWLLEHGRKLA